MSAPELAAPLSGLAAIPLDSAGATFPAPWAARAFALTTALEAGGVLTWSEWAAALGPAVAAETAGDPGDPEAYWRAWIAALEGLLAGKQVADAEALRELADAWRRAAEATPHGEPIELTRPQ